VKSIEHVRGKIGRVIENLINEEDAERCIVNLQRINQDLLEIQDKLSHVSTELEDIALI
jgi:hypothetical protein